MQTCISFLRGVNMTGHNSMKMTDLSELFNDLGYNDPLTYIQSGNVIFSNISDTPESEVTLKIENAIHKRYNYTVPVMIRTVQEMRNIISLNPFVAEEKFEPSKMAVIFLHETATDDQIRKVANVSYPPDKFKITGREIFIYCPNGFGRTKLYTNFFEKKMGVTGTARNWKTITEVLQIAEKKQ